jgi:hypothetical protein
MHKLLTFDRRGVLETSGILKRFYNGYKVSLEVLNKEANEKCLEKFWSDSANQTREFNGISAFVHPGISAAKCKYFILESQSLDWFVPTNEKRDHFTIDNDIIRRVNQTVPWIFIPTVSKPSCCVEVDVLINGVPVATLLSNHKSLIM